MKDKSNILLLTVATILIVVAYLFWGVVQNITGYDIYFPGIALFILMVSFFIWKNFKYTISFILMWLAFGNFIDEVCFDNTALYFLEIAYAVLVLIVAYFYNKKKKKHYGKTVNKNDW